MYVQITITIKCNQTTDGVFTDTILLLICQHKKQLLITTTRKKIYGAIYNYTNREINLTAQTKNRNIAESLKAEYLISTLFGAFPVQLLKDLMKTLLSS